MFSGRKFISVLSLAAFLAGAFVFGVAVSYNDPLSVPIYDISTGAGSISFLQISDLHNHQDGYGDGNSISATIREKNPDYLFLTGDLIDSHTEEFSFMDPFLSTARELDIPMYYVHGNHEMALDSQKVLDLEAFLDSYGAHNLNNASADLGNYTVTGLGDPSIKTGVDYRSILESELAEVEGTFDRSKYNIVLCHQPRFSLLLSHAGFDLALSGHTHGGQGTILGRAFLSSNDLYHGLYERGDFKHVVSAGAGYSFYMPIRFFQESEIPFYRLS